MRWLKNIFVPDRGTPSGMFDTCLIKWFQVRFDDTQITLKVKPPNHPAWEAHIKWERIIRVCFKANGWETPDDIHIFTDERPESYLIPMTAVGGDALWDEIIRRKLFDAEMAIEAASSIDQLSCWPIEQ